MVFENEELRLRTINISADVERGQSDIRKLRRENELLRREIWTLRDEYDRLDKLLHEHHIPKDKDQKHVIAVESSDDTEQDSTEDESCGLCTEIENNDENLEIENNETFLITNRSIMSHNANHIQQRHNVSFDMLSVVSEEPSDIHSCTPNSTVSRSASATTTQPQMTMPQPKHFFAPLRPKASLAVTSGSDLGRKNNFEFLKAEGRNAFQKGGNLDDLLKEVENLSRDIHHLQILNNQKIMSQSEENINYQPDVLATSVSAGSLYEKSGTRNKPKPFRSEVSLVLAIPGAPPRDAVSSHPTLIGFEKFGKTPVDAATNTTPPIEESPSPRTLPPTILKTEERLSEKACQLRKDYIKSPSHSLNELSSNSSKSQPHSKNPLLAKRRSLDQIITSDSNDKPPPDSPSSQHDHHHHGHHSKRPDSRRPSFFFNRRANKKDKKHDDDDDMTFNPLFQFDQMKNSQSLRGAIMRNGKTKKMSMKDSPALASGSRFRQKTTDKFSQKYSRLSIDSGNFESQDSGTAAEFRLSLSDDKCSSDMCSSAESTDSFQSRKMSITSNGTKSGEKIPWCGCWGNGCF